jgi:HEAT repeat protein
MAKRRIEDQLEQLSALRHSVPDTALALLRQFLENRTNLVVAKAASISAELKLNDAIPDLLRAFDRCFTNPVATDPQCWAKNAIVQALKDLGYDRSAPFVRGLTHVQKEPVWGTTVDTAIVLRSSCVLALTQCVDLTRKETLQWVIDALTEKEHPVRTEAARALAQMGGDECALLLRLKARAGDHESPVTGQVLESLISLEGEPSFVFIEQFLRSSEPEIREEAALALGASRLPAAIALLQRAWEAELNADVRGASLRAISVSRNGEALDFLISLVKDGRDADCDDALHALVLHESTPEIYERVEQAVASRKQEKAQSLFFRLFRKR